MTKRGVPRIDPANLRDHATDERVARVWDRLDHDVMHIDAPHARRSSRVLIAALAAASLAFCGGIVVGKLMWSTRLGPDLPSAVRSDDEHPVLEVLAAGTQGRTFQLPGGGQITLSPGSTVELVRQAPAGYSLRLVQGEAQVSTVGSPSDHALAITAGEATLSAWSGTALRVRRNADDLDVSVSDGSVQLTAPSGSRSLVRGEHIEAVPIRTITALVPTNHGVRPLPIAVATSTETPLQSEAPAATVIAAAPDWHARSAAGDESGALALLRRQPGGVDGAIASARSGQELMDVHDAVLSGDDVAAAMRALTRIVESFPNDEYAQIAAFKLGNMYKAAGQLDKSRTYFEKAQSLKGALAEDALCKQFRAAANKEDATRMAREYLDKYPDGRCKDDAERILRGEFNPLEDEEQTADAGADSGSR